MCDNSKEYENLITDNDVSANYRNQSSTSSTQRNSWAIYNRENNGTCCVYSQKQSRQTVQIMKPTNTYCSVAFVKDLQKKMGYFDFTHPEKLNDSEPLIVVCPLVCRLKPDVNHAITSVERSSPYVVIILHTGSERNLPAVPSEQKLREYNNIIFIDMVFNEDGILKCQHNEDAVDKLCSYIESRPLPSTSSTYGAVSIWPEGRFQKYLTDIPWRHPVAISENSLIQDIEKLSPKKKLAILLIGPVGSGKSSFIKSCLFLGGNGQQPTAPTESSDSSFPLIYDSDDNRLLKDFRLMEGFGRGFHVDDIIFFLQGHVDRNYQFDPEKPMTTESKYYRGNPNLEHKTYCIVLVIDAKEMHSGISNEYVENVKILQDEIRHKIQDLPRVLILTKADLLCDKVHEDPSNMFRSLKVETVVKTASEVLSIKLPLIHPVINYEVISTEKNNISILLALRQILRCASDKFELELNEPESESDEEEDSTCITHL